MTAGFLIIGIVYIIAIRIEMKYAAELVIKTARCLREKKGHYVLRAVAYIILVIALTIVAIEGVRILHYAYLLCFSS